MDLSGRGGARHVISFKKLGEESLLLKGPEEVYRLSFANCGTYHYACTIQPGLKGVIEVVEAENFDGSSKMKNRRMMGLAFDEADESNDSDGSEERFLSSCRK